jgi:ketosteroid isomerase-like protein
VPGPVEIIERLSDAWNRQDWDAVEDWFLPDAYAIAPEGWPEGEDIQGWPGIRRQFERLTEPWDESRWEPAETELLAGDAVIQHGIWRVRGHGSGIPVESEFWIVLWLRGEKVRQVGFFVKREQALAAMER